MKLRNSVLVISAVAMLSVGSARASVDLNWKALDRPDALKPEARRYGTLIHDASRSRLILFGGLGTSGFLNDVWSFDLTSNQWSRLQPQGRAPEPRFGHNAVVDPETGSMIVWAGQQGSRFYNDTWILDLASMAWRETTPSRRPAARYGSAAVFDPVTRRLVQFAGFTQESARFQDTQAFDPRSVAWQDLTPGGAKPQVRCLHTAAYDTRRRRMIVFGGQRSGPLGDLWEMDLATNTWRDRTVPGGPSARFLSTTFMDGSGRLFVFGGATLAGDSNDTWMFDPADSRWSRIVTAESPTARSGMMGVWVESEERFILFGGSGNGLLNDTWELRSASARAIAADVPALASRELDAGLTSGSPLAFATIRTSGSGIAGSLRLRVNSNGEVSSEVALPFQTLLRKGRFPVSAGQEIRTAVSIVNPGTTEARILLRSTDSAGNVADVGRWPLAPGGQIAIFTDEPPFSLPPTFNGALTLEADMPVGIVALRSAKSVRDQTVWSHIPVASLADDAPLPGSILPLLAVGNGWSTEIVLVNRTDVESRGSLRFNNRTASYAIPPAGSVTIAPPTDQSLFAEIRPDDGSTKPEAFARLALRSPAGLVTETTIPAVAQVQTVWTETETSRVGTSSASRTVRTAVAAANLTDTSAVIRLETLLEGSPAVAAQWTIPPQTRLIRFVDEFPELAGGGATERKLLRFTVESGSAGIAVVRNRMNSRGDYVASAMATFDDASLRAGDFVSPLIVSTPGFESHFALLNPRTSSATISIRFQSATPLP